MLKKNDNVTLTILEQIDDVKKTLLALQSFLRAESVPETATETLRVLMTAVCDAERDADTSLRAMIDSLQGGRYLPSTREDIIAIATSCDKVANKCETVAKHIVFRHFRFPEAYSADVLQIIATTIKQFDVLEDVIGRLFSKMGELLRDHSVLDQIRALESEVDVIEDKLHEDIFNMETELSWKLLAAETLDLLCDISDITEDIADKIQIMLIARKA